MSEGISKTRMIIYLMILGLLPIAYLAWGQRTESARLTRIEQRIDSVQQKALLRENKQALNQQVRNYYLNTDRFYIDKHVDSLQLLGEETELLERIINNTSVAPDPRITRRLEQLKANKLEFREGSVESYPYFNEIPETQARSVEVDTEDIRTVLARLEGVTIGDAEPGPSRPQIILIDFRLDRKQSGKDMKLYSLNTKLIKREFQ